MTAAAVESNTASRRLDHGDGIGGPPASRPKTRRRGPDVAKTAPRRPHANADVPRRSIERQWRFGGPGRPKVTIGRIRGESWISMDLCWPVLVWNRGACWAYLHDLDLDVVACVLESLRRTELERSHPHSSLNWS